MPVGIIIGIVAGLASALLFYSAAGGSPLLSTVLLLLTPLPTLLAGLGWGWLPAAAGGAAGALAVLVLAASTSFAIGYVLALGVPAAGIAYAAYLSRALPDEPAREWYPAGRLLAGMSLYAGALPLLIPALTGGSYEELRAPAAEFSRRLSQRAPELGLRPLNDEQIAGLAQAFVASLPAVLAAYWLAVFSLNTYLAGRIAQASGRLGRDWPDLTALTFPAGFTLLLAPALAATLFGGVWRHARHRRHRPHRRAAVCAPDRRARTHAFHRPPLGAVAAVVRLWRTDPARPLHRARHHRCRRAGPAPQGPAALQPAAPDMTGNLFAME